MVVPECVLRATVGAELYKQLEPYRLTSDAQMPWAYQRANPQGRPLHNDWALFKDTPRFGCARRVPLPFAVTKGDFRQEWLNFNPAYPVSPGMETRYLDDGTFQVLTDRGNYGLVEYSAFIGGGWTPVFKKYTRAYDIPFLGRYRHSWYVGLHQDNNPGDLMCWIEPFAMSFVREI